VTKSPKWDGLAKFRLHKCQSCGKVFYSTERDRSGIAAKILAEAMN
jgi:hypothetical protein